MKVRSLKSLCDIQISNLLLPDEYQSVVWCGLWISRALDMACVIGTQLLRCFPFNPQLSTLCYERAKDEFNCTTSEHVTSRVVELLRSRL
jgi:hypothetical protein